MQVLIYIYCRIYCQFTLHTCMYVVFSTDTRPLYSISCLLKILYIHKSIDTMYVSTECIYAYMYVYSLYTEASMHIVCPEKMGTPLKKPHYDLNQSCIQKWFICTWSLFKADVDYGIILRFTPYTSVRIKEKASLPSVMIGDIGFLFAFLPGKHTGHFWGDCIHSCTVIYWFYVSHSI